MNDIIPPAEETQLSMNDDLQVRRQEVAAYIYSGKPIDELAKKYNVGIATIQNDKRIILEVWRRYYSKGIQEFQSQELAYALGQREEVRNQWQLSRKSSYQNLLLQWSDYIAKLLGLYAPSKSVNLNVDYAEYSKTQGVSLQEVGMGLVKELTEMIKGGSVQLSDEDLAPLLEAIENRPIEMKEI